jgi:hypothetical protein
MARIFDGRSWVGDVVAGKGFSEDVAIENGVPGTDFVELIIAYAEGVDGNRLVDSIELI